MYEVMPLCACNQGEIHMSLHLIDICYGSSADVVPDGFPQSQLSL